MFADCAILLAVTRKQKFLYAAWACSLFAAALLFIPPVQNVLARFIASLAGNGSYLQWQKRFASYGSRPFWLLAVLPVFFFYQFRKLWNMPQKADDEYGRLFTAAFLTITSICIMFVCTTSSPLYPFNTWGDSNCFFIMGRGIVNGRVAYRDLYEQKGPFIYFIHALAAFLSPNNFHGVFIIECIAASFFSLFAYKTLRLFAPKEILFLMPLLTAVIHAAYNMSMGDLAEEFAIPFFMYALYVSTKHLYQDSDYTGRELVGIGICFGCVFWMKYTLCGFFIGWIAVPVFVYCRRGKLKELGLCIVFFLLGFFLSTLPYFCYFGYHRAIKDLLTVYFYNNIFIYSSLGETGQEGAKLSLLERLVTMGKNCIHPLFRILHKNFYVSLLLPGSLAYLFVLKKRAVCINVLLTMLTSYFFIYFLNVYWHYSSAVFNMYIIFAAIPLYHMLFQTKLRQGLCAFSVGLFSLCFCLFTYRFAYMAKTAREELPQYKFAAYLAEQDIAEPSLLTVGFMDTGFYTVCNIQPSCKYFSSLNIPLKDMENSQKYYIDHGITDFVITKTQEDFEQYAFVMKLEPYYVYRRREPL